jgi:hypothetical protein
MIVNIVTGGEMSRITPSISLNDEEQQDLAEWKRFIGETDTSKALKAALFFSNNVARNLFGFKLSNLLQRRVKFDKLEKEFEANQNKIKSATDNRLFTEICATIQKYQR